MLTFYVPPGIGDFSAMYAKLCNINRDIFICPSSENPQRLGPFLDILPKIRNAGYAACTWEAPVNNTLPPGTDIASLDDGDYFLSINKWMEDGNKIKDWIPGKTDYHYAFSNQAEADYASHFLQDIEREPGSLLIGIYCSAYGNSRHWGFWDYTLWRTFLTKVVGVLPKNTVYLFIGAEYDLAIADILHGWMQSVGFKSHLLLGEFHIGSTIEIIRNLNYFISFPSGLGFIADVINTPHTMYMPHHLKPMCGTFCDPENYENHRSHHLLFCSPEEAFEDFEKVGLQIMRGENARL